MTKRFIIVMTCLALLALPTIAPCADNRIAPPPSPTQQVSKLMGTWHTQKPQMNRGYINTITLKGAPRVPLGAGGKGNIGQAVGTSGTQTFNWKPGPNDASIVMTNFPGYPGTQHFYVKWINDRKIEITEPSNHWKSVWYQ